MAAASECSYPAWTKSLRNLANVLAITIANPLKGCGEKGFGQQRYKFFTENYVHDVFVKEAAEEEGGRSRTSEMKGRCCRNQKKSEAPHALELKIIDKEGEGNVDGVECPCKAR